MQDKYTELPWEESGWLQQVTGWIHSQLATSGREVIGPVELVHQRPWSIS